MSINPDSEALRLLEDWIASPRCEWTLPTYGVGGYFRDRELGRDPKDLDLAVESPGGAKLFADSIAKSFSETTTAPHQLGRTYPIWEIKFLDNVEFQGVPYFCKDSKIQMADTQKEAFMDPQSRQRVTEFGNLAEDCARRDFTVNMLYWDLRQKKLLDPSKAGLRNLREKILHHHPEVDPLKMFSDDPLRILRLFRFEAQLDFKAAPLLEAAATASKNRLSILSFERIRDEFNKAAVTSGLAPMIEGLERCGGLDLLLPELKPMKGCEQDRIFHSEGNVFVHTMLVLRNAPRTLLLQWAALLHDAGKPATRSVEGERVKFIGHEIVSETLAREILKRFLFPLDLVDQILLLIRHHLRGGDVLQWKSLKPARRLLRDLEGLEGPWLQLVEADSRSSLGRDGQPRLEHLAALRTAFQEAGKIPVSKKPTLSGREIMRAFAIPPGREIGRLLKVVEEIEDDWASRGQVLTKDEALTELAKRENLSAS
jgi:poly(A) polymerase